MSRRNSNTTSDALLWDEATSLILSLFRDGDYRISMLIATGCFTGLRISDLLSLRWTDIFSAPTFEIPEKKTRKRRIIKVNPQYRRHAFKCYTALDINDMTEKIFISRRHTIYSIQRVNVILKNLRRRYGLHVEHFSSHSLRKTFGRHIVEMAGTESEMALIKLSEIFNHSSPKVTRIYLGLRQEELLATYDMLGF